MEDPATVDPKKENDKTLGCQSGPVSDANIEFGPGLENV